MPLPTPRHLAYHPLLIIPIVQEHGKIEIIVRMCDEDKEAVPRVSKPCNNCNEISGQRSYRPA